MENLDLISVLTIIGSILTFIITCFNKGQKEYEKLLKDYFDKIVVVYVNKYKKQNNIDPVKFIKKNLKDEEYFIPSYILYLVKNNNKDELHKVIVEDYKEKFPNNKKSFISTFDSISNIIILLSIVSYFILGIPLIVSIIKGGTYVIENIYYRICGDKGAITVGNIILGEGMYSIVSVSIEVVMLVGLMFLSRFIISSANDDYTLNKEKIKKIINKKVKQYDNKHKKYFIY